MGLHHALLLTAAVLLTQPRPAAAAAHPPSTKKTLSRAFERGPQGTHGYVVRPFDCDGRFAFSGATSTTAASSTPSRSSTGSEAAGAGRSSTGAPSIATPGKVPSRIYTMACMSNRAAHASASGPPRAARIREGVGMAHVRLRSKARVGDDPQRVLSGPMRKWGPVDNDFCFEGSSCQWSVPGGGVAGAEIGNGRVQDLYTSSRRWHTRRGVHLGSTVGAVRRRYVRALRFRSCSFPYGAERDAVFLLRRRSSTAFVIEHGRVSQIWVMAERATERSGC